MVGIIIAFIVGSLFGVFIIGLMRGASDADDTASRLFQEKYGENGEDDKDTKV